jgi:phage gpG-like protein
LDKFHVSIFEFRVSSFEFRISRMIEFTYTLNSEPVENALAGFQESLADQQPALAAIADDFREMIAQQFASEGRAEGTPWPPLAPATLRRRRGLTPILYQTGALLRSLSEPGATGHVEEIEDYSLTLGSRLPYAVFHQTGTRRLPARPIIVLSGARSERWTEIVRREIEQKAMLLGAKELAGEEG